MLKKKKKTPRKFRMSIMAEISEIVPEIENGKAVSSSLHVKDINWLLTADTFTLKDAKEHVKKLRAVIWDLDL